MADPGLVASPGRRTAERPGAAGVLIVDDSRVVRRLVRRVLEDEPGLKIIGDASEGSAGLAMIRSLRPDVVVLDLNMPGLDGRGVIKAVKAEGIDCSLVVFANIDASERQSVEAELRAVGAVLVIKPTGVADATQALAEIRDCLIEPVRRVAERPRESQPRVRRVVNAVVIASSTGGPHALEEVLGNINDLRVPIFIVQHIADGFSGRLAERLSAICRFPVIVATDGQRPEPGHAYLGPGGIHLRVERDGEGTVLRLRDSPPVNSCKPAADVLFMSSAEVYGGHQLGLVLTGIGRDGFDGCRELAARGAPILVQDEETSVVWGMPGVVAKAGLADEILPIEDIAARVQGLTVAPTRRPVPNRTG